MLIRTGEHAKKGSEQSFELRNKERKKKEVREGTYQAVSACANEILELTLARGVRVGMAIYAARLITPASAGGGGGGRAHMNVWVVYSPGHLGRRDEYVLSAGAEGVGVQARRVVVRQRVAGFGPALSRLRCSSVPFLKHTRRLR